MVSSGLVKEAFCFPPAIVEAVRHLFRVAAGLDSMVISEEAVSVGSVAADLAKKIVRELSDKTVLIIGAGEMALETILHLKETGVKNLLVSNHTMSGSLLRLVDRLSPIIIWKKG